MIVGSGNDGRRAMRSKLTILILVAAVAGILAGHFAHEMSPDAATSAKVAGYFSILADVFLA